MKPIEAEKQSTKLESSENETHLQNPQTLSVEDSKFVSISLASLERHTKSDGCPSVIEKKQFSNQSETVEKGSRENRLLDTLGIYTLKNFSFILVCVSQICVHFGIMVVYTHLVAYAVTANLSAYQGSFIGIGNLIGRIISGVIVSLTTVSEPCVYVLVFLMSGIAVSIIPLTVNFPLLLSIGFLFGMSYGSQCAVLPQIVIGILGLHHLVTGFGYVCIFAGIGSVVGPPVAGKCHLSLSS